MGEDEKVLLAELLSVQRELLTWTRFEGMQKLKIVLEMLLKTDKERKIYELSTGEYTSTQIGKAVGVTDQTVRNYWKKWARAGVVKASEKIGKGFAHLCSLEDLSIEAPAELPKIPAEKGVPPATTAREAESSGK